MFCLTKKRSKVQIFIADADEAYDIYEKTLSFNKNWNINSYSQKYSEINAKNLKVELIRVKSLDPPASVLTHTYYSLFPLQCEMFMFSFILTKKTCYLLKDLSDGRTIWIDTLEFSVSNAWVKTGVVIGIFSVVAFFPNMYLYLEECTIFKIWNTKHHNRYQKKRRKMSRFYLTRQHHWNLYFLRDCRLLFLQLWKDHTSLPVIHKW